MALTLRELLDKQRAEREAKERNGGGGGATPATPVAATEQPTKLNPPQPVTQSGRSLLDRFKAQSPAPTPAPNGRSEQQAPAAQITKPEEPPSAPPASFSEDEVATLRKNLAFLANNMEEKAVLGQVLRSTVKHIQEHPELNAVTVDGDFDLIVAAARKSMQFVARKKEDKADVKGKKKASAEELAAFLKDQGIEL